MKLVPWLLLVHMVALAIASGIAIATDRDGDKLMAWAIALLVSGWTSIVAALLYLIIGIIRKQAGLRDVVMCGILAYIGTVEKNEGGSWHDYLDSLPG